MSANQRDEYGVGWHMLSALTHFKQHAGFFSLHIVRKSVLNISTVPNVVLNLIPSMTESEEQFIKGPGNK